MTQNIVGESEVKKILNIETFRNLSKEKIMEFVSLIPYMDKEVAISVINQFPNYVVMAKEMTELLNSACESVIEKNNDSRKDVIETYRSIIDKLASMLDDDDLSESQQRYITETMVNLADKIAEKDNENKKFHIEIVKYLEFALFGLAMIGATVLGVNSKTKSIPHVS